MSAGRVVVASNTGPVREVIEHGVNGLLVDFFDVKALAKQVVEVLRAPEAVAQLGQRARQTVINRYDLQTQCLPQLMALLALRTSGGAAQRLR
jgi:glycosyltransferase involved in cell wall biosynthesis